MTGDPAQTVVILPAERAVQIDGETRQIGARAFDVMGRMDRSLRGIGIPE